MRPDRRIFTLQTDRLPSAAQFSGRLPQSQSIVPKASLSVLNGNLILAAAQKYPKVVTRLPANYLTETATYTAVRGTFPANATTRQSGQSDANADASNTSCEMKTKRNLIQICLLATALLLPAVAQAQFTFYTINGAITITGYTGASGNVTIPSTINGYPVTTIAFAAFYTNSTLTSLTIPNSVTNIGASACWECPNLGSITLPGTIAGIGDYAFFNCPSLTNATISFGVASLGNGMFDECSSLTSITIPASVTTIGVNAFRSSGLASVTIPGSVTNIGTEAFQDCLNLTNATFASGANTIADYAFSGCSNLHQAYFQGNAPSVNGGSGSTDNTVFYGESGTVYYLPGTTGWGTTFGGWPTAVLSVPVSDFTYITNNGAITITGYMGTNGNVIIPGTINGWLVTAIGPNAFFDDSLTSVTIGANVTTIGDYAFGGCNLTNVIIPNSVLTIGYSAFFACDLTSVTIPGSVTNIGQWAFENCPLLNAAYFEGNAPTVGGGPGSADYTVFVDNYGPVFEQGTVYYLPGTTGWGSNFGGWPTAVLSVPVVDFTYTTNNGAITITGYSGPSDMIIPSSINGYPVTTIGYRAFLYQSFLSSVTIPNSVTNIAEEAFYDCSGLTNLTIPDGVTSIGERAFAYCSGLTSVTLPNRLASIGDAVFNECTGLKSVTIPNSVTSIGVDAFCDCSNLTSVTIPNSVTSIGDLAFTYAGLKSVTIPNSVTCIGNYAFEACPALTNATIANSVTNLGVYVFGYCFNLHQAYFQGNAPSVNGGAGSTDNTVFYGESGTVYYLPGTTGWGSNFGGWPAAVQGSPVVYFTYATINGAITITGYTGSGGNVTIPGSINGYPVTAIGNLAFYNKTTVTGVIIPNSVTNIGEQAFLDCSGLTSITIPNSVTGIGIQVFVECSSLTNIAVDAANPSYTSAGGVLFNKALTTLIECPPGLAGNYAIPDSVTSIDDYAFADCSGLTNLTIGSSVSSIGINAFADCSGLTSVTIPNSVTSISYWAFEFCSGLTNVTIGISVNNIGGYAFFSCTNLHQVYFLGNAPGVNGGAGSADSTVFQGESGTAYYIQGATGWGAAFGSWPTAARSIPVAGFTYTTNNGTITITGYTGAGGNVTIPGSINGYAVTTIGADAFHSQTTLTSVTIPNSVSNIGSYAFSDCTNLHQAYFQGNAPSVNGGAGSADSTVFQGESGTAYYMPVTTGWGATFGGWPTAFPANPASDFIYTTNNGAITITDYTGPGGNVTIPSPINGYPVTAIGTFAFNYRNTVTGVIIPNSVTSIDGCFYRCYGLSNVTIGNSVTNIGDSTFFYCYRLTSVTIPDSVTSISDLAFADCSGLTNVTIGNSVTSIGDLAFAYSGLTSVTIPSSVTSIGGGPFLNDSGLTNIAVDSANLNYASAGRVLFNKSLTTLIECPGGLADSYTIPNGVTGIGYEAFDHCSGLTSVTIPDSVTNISDWAFTGCSGLTNVTIGHSVTNIGSYAFNSCSSLHQAYFQGNAPIVNGGAGSVDNTLFSGESGTVYYLPGTTGWGSNFGGWPTAVQGSLVSDFTFTTNNGAITITGYTGSGGNVTIPSTINGYPVTSIGYEAFSNHTAVTGVIIPNSVTSIGDGAFYNCYSLKSVTIGTNVTSIGAEAFQWCANLTSVTIPNSVTNIGDYAFYWCASLTNLTIGNNVTSIGYGVFAFCDDLMNVTIPNSVTSLGEAAFFECNDLTNITIPNSVTSVGSSAFRVCASLTSVTIGTNVTSIGEDAFWDCTSLTNVTIPNSVTNIGDDAFYNCSSLKAITVASNNPAYSSVNGILFDISQTTLIQYPGGIAGNYTIPNCVTNIGSDAFACCSSLTSVTIPNSVTSIGNSAFADCNSLTNVTIGNSVTSIGNSAFAYCNSLTRVYFQGNAPSLGSDVFDYPISEIFGGIINTYYVFDPATIYYLPGTTGWDTTFGGCPTALWFLPNPTILNFEPNFGVQANGFGFTISWATNVPVAVEACTNLANPVWTPVTTNALVNGTYYFSDPQWTNYPGRFYRLRSP